MIRQLVRAVDATDPSDHARQYGRRVLWPAAVVTSVVVLVQLTIARRPGPAAALWAQTAIVLLLAPAPALAAISGRRREGTLRQLFFGPWRTWQTLVAAGLRPWLASVALVAASGAPLWILAARQSSGERVRLLLAQSELAVIALALATLGLVCSVFFADTVSAAAVAYAVVLILLALPLLITPAIDGVAGAQPVIQASLLASPAVAVSSALGVDLMRTQWVYRASPIGQRRFSYPSAAAVHLFFVLMTLALSVLATSRLAIERRAGGRRRSRE